MPAASPKDYYRRAVFIPLLDCVTSDLSSRFTDDIFNTLNELTRFIPSDIVVNYNSINGDNILKTYGSCLTAQSVPVDQFVLRAEVDLWRQKWRRTQTAVSLNKLSYSCSAFCWHFKSSSFTLLFTSPHLVSFHFISSSHLFL